MLFPVFIVMYLLFNLSSAVSLFCKSSVTGSVYPVLRHGLLWIMC